ncbi:MAG TPA: hypothetical protein VMR14_19580 [Streptosporangiaceae bacterium]|nr:hypothetical protein [Streptosporangiaceae bacterium]
MIIILGLIILVAALVVAVAGVLGNGGSAHAVSHFSVLGYHFTGSAGTLFLLGIVVGAAGLLGLSLMLAGARRTSRRGSAARRGLRQSRRETAAASQQRDDLIGQRDDLIGQRDNARAYAVTNPGSDTAAQHSQLSPDSDRPVRLRVFRRRSAPAQADVGPSGPMAAPSAADFAAGPPATDVPAGPSASDLPAGVSAVAD